MAYKPFIPKVARRLVEASKDQRSPSNELKAALYELMIATQDPELPRG